MRLKKEEYNRAELALKHYNYNVKNIREIEDDIFSINAISYDGGIHTYTVTDTVLSKVIQKENNKELQVSLYEFQAVQNALLLVSEGAKIIFQELYLNSKEQLKYDTMHKYGLSARTYERRKAELIYTTYNQLKKLAKKWRNFGEILIK